ncbi:MAG TPA: cell surface protein SprA [Acidobacteriota bacterium]|nr:cell surface protein SprA [Acidobacteriota bacterium]
MALGVFAFAAALLGASAVAPSSARADLEFRALQDPALLIDPMSPPMGNGLPPNWRLQTPPAVFEAGAARVRVTLDPTTGVVQERYREGSVEVREPLVVGALDYNELLSERSYRKVWRERTQTTRSVNKAGLRQGGLFRFTVPVQLPKAVRSIVGDGAPNIEVSGSERIAIVGTSDWTVQKSIYQDLTGERKRQGAFPSFEMKQELNVNLTGSIGDKIKVDVDQSSNVTTSVDNRVKLRYEGDEDDMIKTIELGNTNLSLQGASLRQEGLFGVKTVMKMGNFDWTAIASKQDAKTETARFTPSGENRQVRIYDLDYVRRTYFFFHDAPIQTSTMNLRVYRANPGGQQDLNIGVGRPDPTAPRDSLTNPSFPSRYWQILTIGVDFDLVYPWVLTDVVGDLRIPVIKLRSQLGETQVLGVAYDVVEGATTTRIGLTGDEVDSLLEKEAGQVLLKIVQPRINDLPNGPNNVIDPAGPWYSTLKYELRNYYDLQGRDIDPTSLTVKLRRIDNTAATDPDDVGGTPILRIVGLDQQAKAGSEDPFAADGLVDDQYVNLTDGILFFPDLHPFAPGPDSTCASGRGGFLCLDDLRRNILTGERANPNVYYNRLPERNKDERYYIEAEFRSSQQGYYVGRFGILENSEQVKVDGIPQTRDSDYRIDYQTGQLTFLRTPPGPQQVITVDFSYAPGFGQVQRTLAGLSGAYNPASNLSFSSSLLYESRGASEQNPKLGEEPAHTMLGDFGTVLSFRPVWMTRLADQVPGITTDQSSALNIQGNFSASVPNPNTKGEAYIDDMEGNRESNTIGLGRLQWFWSSTPVNRRVTLPPDTNLAVTTLSNLGADHARLEWYNPRPEAETAAKEWDLKPVLTEAEGGNNSHQVLELNVKPPAGETTVDPLADWSGLTQSLSAAGLDFSRVRFLEIWVNDLRKDHATTKARLHIDLGSVSEDAFWHPAESPNNLLDTEDKNNDGKLDGADDPTNEVFEDTGFDRKVSSLETGYDPNLNPDPSGDDYRYNVREAPDDYSTINNLELNGINDPNARPDTEDLNRDTFFDTRNSYFETSIDLADDQYVAIDIPNDPATSGLKVVYDNPLNGWRLFRIPVDGTTFRTIGAPNWQNIQHMRVWLSDMDQPLKIQLGGIEFVGSRWLEAAITDSNMVFRDVQLDIRTRNNKDDLGVYVPPYEVQNQVGNTADRREQSLALGYTRLEEGDTLLAYRTLGEPGTGLGWAQYRDIKFYVHGEAGVESQNLRALFRVGPDTLNYYEYSVPVRSDWQSILLPMEALSRLKEERPLDWPRFAPYVDSTSAAGTSEVFTVFGNPSFTRIIRLSFGLAVKGGAPGVPQSGEVWINELRLADVRKESGLSSNVSIQANFADLLAVNVSLAKQDEDFFRVGQGGNQGTGLNHTAIGFSTTLQVDRFMPTSGVSLPVRFSMQHSTDVPKFRTGSDVTLDADQSGIETRRLDQQSVDISYRRSSAIRRGLAKYTIDAFSGTMAYTRRGTVNPQSTDSSWSFSSSVGYDLPIGGGGVSLGKKFKLNLLPETIGFSAGWASSRAVAYSRSIFNDSVATELRSDAKVRLLTLGTTTSYVPFSSFRIQYNLTSQRDMLLKQESGLGFNKGMEVDHLQTVQVNYTPRWLAILQPNINLRARYHEDARPERRVAATDPLGLKNVDNQGGASVRFSVPISRLGRRGAARRAGPADTTGGGFSLLAPLGPVRYVLTKFQDVQTNFSFERAATLTRVTGDPGTAFKSGFSQVSDPTLLRLSGSNFTANRRYTTNLSTAFRPSTTVNVDIRADHALSYADQSFGERRTERIQWPDLKGRWSDLHRFLHLETALKNLTLQSGFSKVSDEEGPADGPTERRTKTRTFGPLLGWDMVFRNDVRASLSSSVTKATSIDDRAFGVERERQTTNTDVRLNKTFPASKGIKFPWSKNRVRLPNDLNLNLTVGLQGDRAVVRRAGERDYEETNQERLNVASGTTYNFTRTISGGFNFAYRQTHDKKLEVKNRGISVEFNAQFSF